MATLAIDVGYLRYQQRLEQAAADSAAIAGAIALDYSTAASLTYISNAKTDAALNGFDAATDPNVTVTIKSPYNGNAKAVEATITKHQPMFFANVFGITTQNVTVRAVAAPNVAGRACVYALSGDITINGGAGGFLAPNCGIVSDAGLRVNGQGTVDALSIGYGTGAQPSGGTYPEATPAPLATYVPDPCSITPACAVLAAATPAPPLHPTPVVSNGITYYFPGTYTNFNPASNAVLCGGATAATSIFVLNGGLTTSGTGSISDPGTGAPLGCNVGITIYNSSGPFKIGGTTSLQLTAFGGMTSGIVYFQPLSNLSNFTFNGAAGTNGFQGGIYMPSADMILNGNLPSVNLLVTASITINGGGINVSNSATTDGFGHVVLVE